MFARVTKYRIKKESIKDAIAMMERIKPQVMALPGMQQFLNVMDKNGNGYIVAIIESEATSNANMPRVMEIWANFREMLVEPPAPAGFDVLVNEKNG